MDQQQPYGIHMGRHGRDRMVVEFTATCAISDYHHYNGEFEFRSWWGVFDAISCDEACQWLATGRWFSPGTPISSRNKTYCHDIAEISLKVALNTIALRPYGIHNFLPIQQ